MNPFRFIRARCYPLPFDQQAEEAASDSQIVELSVLGPRDDDGKLKAKWTLRIETASDGAWEVQISEMTALALISDSRWNVQPFSSMPTSERK